MNRHLRLRFLNLLHCTQAASAPVLLRQCSRSYPFVSGGKWFAPGAVPACPIPVLLRGFSQAGDGWNPSGCGIDEAVYDSYLHRFDPTGGTGICIVRNCFGRNRYMVRMAGGLECSYGYVNQVLSERNLEQENTIAWTSRNRRYLDFGFWLWYALKKEG